MDYFTQQGRECWLKPKLTESCNHFHSWSIGAECEKKYGLKLEKKKVMNKENMNMFIIVQHTVHWLSHSILLKEITRTK